MEEFKKLGLSDKIVKALATKGFKTPTPIQKLTIPLLLKGEKDVLGKAQTGTGKTACFGLPIIERISNKDHNVQAIILTPTRELALQVSKEIESLQGEKKFSILAVYGGASISDQLKRLNKGVQIVVGTPGRVMDLMNRRKLNLSRIEYAVLDEADEMLNMGFVDDIKKILSNTSQNKKMLFFSATMPKEILKIAKTFMKDYEIVEVAEEVTPTLTKQIYYDIVAKDRIPALHMIIDTTKGFHGIIFCKTRSMVDEVAKKLSNADYGAAALHGDISQAQREKILGLFKHRTINILVATDVAARGIDVNDLTHVVNFSLPQSPESYVHRIGRTGRVGKEGIALTFVIPSEKGKLKFIERIVNQKLIKGTLPSVREVLEIKHQNVKEKLKKILTDSNTSKYSDTAKAILKENDAEKAVAALLKFIFKKEIDSNKYKDLQVVPDRPIRDSRAADKRGSRSKRPSDRNRSFSGRRSKRRNAGGNNRRSRRDR